MKITTRDEARQEFANALITSESVCENDLALLRKEINKAMKLSGCYNGTMRMKGKPSMFMSCKTNEWEKREAISFNSDGCIGIAGWADDRNVIPILVGIENFLLKCAEE